MINKGAYLRAIADGIMAQRKLDGDPDVIATDDTESLKAIVRQGKRAEEKCQEYGWLGTLEYGQKMGMGKAERL